MKRPSDRIPKPKQPISRERQPPNRLPKPIAKATAPLTLRSAALSRQDLFIGLCLIAATFIAYLPLRHAGFIWDDETYVTNNPLLTDSNGWWRIWFSQHRQSQYFPLVFTTFRLEYALWGLAPLGYHIVNLLLHCTNVLLVWTVLRRLMPSGAWLAAAVFALHPVQVESVAWVTELKNTESTLFYLLAVLAWMNFLRPDTRRRWLFYGLAMLSHILALSAKTTACTLPAALLLILWIRREPIGWKRIVQVAPFVVVGLAGGLVSIWWERHLGNYGLPAATNYGWVDRILVASRALWFYAGKLIWPAPLVFSYPEWSINPRDLTQYVWLAGCLGVALLFWWRRKALNRGLVAGVVFFVSALAPVSGVIWIYTFQWSYVADHYQYLACVGLIAPAAALAVRVSRNWPGPARLVPLLALIAGLGVLTWRQCAVYRDLETLYRSILAENPESSLALNNLSVVLIDNGRLDEAETENRKLLAMDPDSVKGHWNRGMIFYKRGQVDEAIAEYRVALARDPGYPQIYINLGTALIEKGQIQEAIGAFQQALALNPDSALAHHALGATLARTGQLDDAILQYRKALDIQPRDARVQFEFANLLLQSGKVDEAIAHYRTGLKLAPERGAFYHNLAIALIRKGEWAEAIAECQEGMRIDPGNLPLADALARLWATCPVATLRDGPAAVKLATRVEQASGGKNPMFMDTLAAAYAEAGDFTNALAKARSGLELAADREQKATLEEHIRLYEANRPFHEAPLEGNAGRSQP